MLLIFFTSILLVTISKGDSRIVSCESTKYCSCKRNNQKLQYICQSNSSIDRNIKMNVTSVEISINCHGLILNTTLMPKIHSDYNIKKLIIKECPLSSRFISRMDSRYFEQMRNLETLNLNENNMTRFNPDILKNNPNLHNLSLDHNKLILFENNFQYGGNLTFLSLCNNNISFLPDMVFTELMKLQVLLLMNNKLKDIDIKAFDGLLNLRLLNLSSNVLEHLDDHLFSNSPVLSRISLSGNKLNNNSKEVFVNCKPELVQMDKITTVVFIEGDFTYFDSLELVELTDNELEWITDDLFTPLTHLKFMRLQNNRLTFLPNNIFSDLLDLEELNLSYNKITMLATEIFTPMKKLRFLYLDHNQIQSIGVEMPPNYSNLFHDLEKVDLSYNKLTEYPGKSRIITDAKNISLEFNFIGTLNVEPFLRLSAGNHTINLKNNNISVIQFKNLTKLDDIGSSSKIYIDVSHNPIFCNCRASDFVKYIDVKNSDILNRSLHFQYENLTCVGPKNLKKKSVGDVLPEELTCKLKAQCTEHHICECFHRPYDNALIVDCSERNLSEIPKLEVSQEYTAMELHFNGNHLQNILGNFKGYSRISKLFLHNNNIDNITWIPPSVQVLDLRNNNLSFFNSKFLKLLSEANFEELALTDNPWRCDCGTLEFSNAIRQKIKHIKDVNNIKCNNSEKTLITLNYEDLCPVETNPILNILLISLCFLFVTIVLPLFCYILYGEEILIWLYSQGACLRLIKEERLDKSKIYDAFISFANQDEEFVTKELVSNLETKSPRYKLCLHIRDWKPGEFIATQISNSVRDSRRTLVILSSHFLKSVWGKMEFRAAHTNAMKEGRLRVIIVLYGDIDMNSLDDELKAYMRTNTYIKWGDPWFWEKLRYALPRTCKGKARKI